MAKKLIYSCDYCGKEFGEKKHLSINFGGYAGWVDNVGFTEYDAGGWEHVENFTNEPWIGQFCGPACLGRYFKGRDMLKIDMDGTVGIGTINPVITKKKK